MYRSRDAALGGICTSFARRFDFDPIVVRILGIALCVSTLGLGALAYAVLWAVLPLEPEGHGPCEVAPEQVESSAFGLLDVGGPACGSRADAAGGADLSLLARIAVTLGLLLLFLVVALSVSPMVSGSHWWQFWPVGAVIAGLCLVVIPLSDQQAVACRAFGVTIAALGLSALPMSLGIVSWSTFAYAFSRLWAIVAVAAALSIVGLWRGQGGLVMVGALCIVAFCLVMLLNYSLPGEVEHLLICMPDGRSMRIAFSRVLALL